jgi:hypothetical protein
MSEYMDLLERASERGEPRGIDRVVQAATSRLRRRRRQRWASAAAVAVVMLGAVGWVGVQADDTTTIAASDPTGTVDTSTPAASNIGERCATQMEEVASGEDWTLRQGVGGGLPSLYEVAVNGEVIAGGCSDRAAIEAGLLSWFSVHVGDGVLLFGEVPDGVVAVDVNGEIVDAQSREGALTGLVVAVLPASAGSGPVSLEAIRSDAQRVALEPARIDPTSNVGFVVPFNR